MPYCPKCDMEFVDGITTCSDCGGALAASREIADAIKKQEQAEADARRQEEYEAMQAAWEAAEVTEDSSLQDLSSPGASQAQQMDKAGKARNRSWVYVKKSQQYDDLKSSASAFLLVGGLILVFSLLCWAKIINIPIAGISRIISQTVMTVLGIVSLVVAIASAKTARVVFGQIADEETTTHQLFQWFTDNHSGAQMDAQILEEAGELAPEELSLKRFELIQDILITSHDIADQAYVDSLSEEIYGNLFQD